MTKLNKEELLGQLKKRHDKRSVTEIEREIDAKGLNEIKAHKNRIIILWYLERTNRWKENKQYRQSTWGTYLKERHMMLENTYLAHLRVYIGFPNETEQYGPELINKIKVKCGVENMPTVLAEFKKLKKGTRTEQEEVINRHAKPTAPATKKINYKAGYQRLLTENAELRAENRELRLGNEEKARQIKRLKETIESLRQQKAA